ncbi:SWIM zinc finger domain-containing protein [uncultured Cocleimonas sp.]|uniref:SWIM zinc finger family protein n=1 Tax=uncultured Cocleimonas sp. TaxID=1051587 RepID=UPI00260E8D76|nr:SWIM zinc finger family protein [uncultured Cocleimonas sp.]
MNLDDFESDINPTIMKRGEDYFNKGLVEDLNEFHAGLWEASIEGTEIYEVEVMLGGWNHNSIRQWYCSCPYNGPICKHVVATLLSIRNNDVKTTSNVIALKAKQPTREEQLEAIIAEISPDKAKKIKATLNSQSDIGKKLTATNYRTRFHAIIKKYSSRGMIDYQSAKGFSRETWELTQALNSSKIAAKVRVDSCFKILESMMNKVVNAIDDSNGDLADLVIDIADVLDGAFPELTTTQQLRCYQQVLFWEFESELGAYGLEQYLDHLSVKWASNKVGLQEIYFQAIDKALTDTSSTWELESLNKKKLEQLSDWGRTTEAEEFALEKIEIPEIRRIFVDKAIKEQDYTTARSLIKQGIKLSRDRQHPGTEADWREVLIDIATQTNDVDSLRSEILKLQKGSAFKIELYRRLKASYTATEWKTVQAEYATKMLGKYRQIYGQSEIYAEEKQLRELFDLIQSNEYEASSLFKRHLNILNAEFPEESANFYAIIIQHELKQTHRKIYQQAVRDIKKLQKLPMGEAIAKQLIREVTLQYKNRPSMLEIFKKAFGDVDSAK